MDLTFCSLRFPTKKTIKLATSSIFCKQGLTLFLVSELLCDFINSEGCFQSNSELEGDFPQAGIICANSKGVLPQMKTTKVRKVMTIELLFVAR